MITIQRKLMPGNCDLHQQQKDEVYSISIAAEKDDYTLCWQCCKRIIDMKLLRAAKVQAAPSLPNGVPAK